MLLNGGGTASATSYTITVDASKQTTGNPRFWAASVGTGTAMPTAMALTGNKIDFPNDIDTYKQFIQAVVQHCVDKYGAADVGQWY